VEPAHGPGHAGRFRRLALALASVGLCAILAYSVSGRQREIGVRMALGASRAAVLRLVLREGMMLVCIGTGIGRALAVDRPCVFENAVRTQSG
jgi:putative ABC transport system permease protein